MNKQTEVLKLSLVAIRRVLSGDDNYIQHLLRAETACQEALAESAMQQLTDVSQEIEAALAQPQVLTDEQIESCMAEARKTVQGRNLEHAFARAIEAAHGIKE